MRNGNEKVKKKEASEQDQEVKSAWKTGKLGLDFSFTHCTVPIERIGKNYACEKFAAYA